MSKRFFIISLTLLFALAPGATHAATNVRDANSNSIIFNGAYSQAELNAKLSKQDSATKALYASHGYSSTDQLQDGTVTSSGEVIVGGKTVATGAKSFGRIDKTGSTQVGHFFLRPTSVSFQQSSLPAFVHMSNGKFQYAIIKSCGNIVEATPVVAQKTKVIVQVQKVPVPTPVPTPAPAPTPSPAPKPLPHTGAASTAAGAAAGLTLLGMAIIYWRRSRKLLQATLLTRV